jgi:hypothetical protein
MFSTQDVQMQRCVSDLKDPHPFGKTTGGPLCGIAAEHSPLNTQHTALAHARTSTLLVVSFTVCANFLWQIAAMMLG